MFIHNVLIPVAMFVFSLDGYNAIDHFRLWHATPRFQRVG